MHTVILPLRGVNFCFGIFENKENESLVGRIKPKKNESLAGRNKPTIRYTRITFCFLGGNKNKVPDSKGSLVAGLYCLLYKCDYTTCIFTWDSFNFYNLWTKHNMEMKFPSITSLAEAQNAFKVFGHKLSLTHTISILTANASYLLYYFVWIINKPQVDVRIV